MPNRRRRNTRSVKLIFDTISTKNFIIAVTILSIIIISCIGVNYKNHLDEAKKVEEEKLRISKYVEDIYTSVEAEIHELNNYKSNSMIRISALGDILLGDNLKNFGKDDLGGYSNIFSNISHYMKDSDIVVGTYEHNITNENKEFAKAIQKAGINLVSLAHNHALDNGGPGLNVTRDYLENLGIQTVGKYFEQPSDRIKIIEKKGVKIAFLSYTYNNNKPGVNIYNEDLVKSDLEYSNENADFSIVLMHWGDVNTNSISNYQRSQAEFLINNGADLIIGAHPSVVQKMEIMKNSEGKDCLIAYSLGDFTSDFESENSNLELILNIQLYYDVEQNQVSLYKVDYIPIYMNDYGNKETINRYKLLDIKNEIANYELDGGNLSKETYEKLIRGIERLNGIIIK